jgi:hypothetical protein
MQPRLKTSQKWTALPPELLGQMKTVLGENFREQIGTGSFEADGRIYPGEILIVTTTQRPGSLRQSGFEVSLAYRQSKDNVLKLLHLGVDAVGALFEQLFAAATDEEFPVLWSPVQFEGREVFVRYTTANTRLEAEADRLLAQSEEDGIAGGDWDAEIDPALIKAQLGIGDDED